MINPTASLTIVDVDIDGDLVFNAVRDGTGYTLITMSRPPFTPRIVRADPSNFTGGSLPTGAVPEESLITALVELSGPTQAHVEAKLARVKTGVYRRSYDSIQTWNGQASTWFSSYGTVVPGEVRYVDLAYVKQRCSLTIPLPKGL